VPEVQGARQRGKEKESREEEEQKETKKEGVRTKEKTVLASVSFQSAGQKLEPKRREQSCKTKVVP
jgi:hypothetical protein